MIYSHLYYQLKQIMGLDGRSYLYTTSVTLRRISLHIDNVKHFNFKHIKVDLMYYLLNTQPSSTVSNYSEAAISRNSAKITEHLGYFILYYLYFRVGFSAVVSFHRFIPVCLGLHLKNLRLQAVITMFETLSLQTCYHKTHLHLQ